MHILTLTSLFPNTLQPHHAVFVRARMEPYIRKYGHRWTVVAPVPFFPRFPFRIPGEYDVLSRVPDFESSRGYPVYHPRYLVTPKVGMRFYGDWMAHGARKFVRRLHAADPFDVIDGHYIYPDGTAAVRLGEELGIPVVLSARGSDLNEFTNLKNIKSIIKTNLNSCKKLICVSEGLRRKALELGVPEGKISLISNGVDADRFRRGDQAAARRRLGLPEGVIVILAVGRMVKMKGFHLVVEACARLGREGLVVVVAGDGPERGSLKRLAGSLGLSSRALFPGAIGNQDLPCWYQAADLMALASSHEGWPNVLCEAQACGLPVVATDVCGIREIIRKESLGLLIKERNVEGLRRGLELALSRDWDRDFIGSAGRMRSWDHVADELEAVFSKTNN